MGDNVKCTVKVKINRMNLRLRAKYNIKEMKSRQFTKLVVVDCF
jgi:hypothetical protein